MYKHADSAQLESLRVQPDTMAVSMFVHASTVDAEYTLQVRHFDNCEWQMAEADCIQKKKNLAITGAMNVTP